MWMNLAASFDKYDRNIFFNTLALCLGLFEVVINRWILIGFKLEHLPLMYGVPQGQILGPLWFNLYLPLLVDILVYDFIPNIWWWHTNMFICIAEWIQVDRLTGTVLSTNCSPDSETFPPFEQGKRSLLSVQRKKCIVCRHLNSHWNVKSQAGTFSVIFESELNFTCHIKSVTKCSFDDLETIERLDCQGRILRYLFMFLSLAGRIEDDFNRYRMVLPDF